MKKLIYIFTFALLSFYVSNCDAQIIRNGNCFSVETVKSNDVKTEYTFKIKDVEYPIYKTSKNKFYILRISKKSGKEYKYYLPEEVQVELRKLF